MTRDEALAVTEYVLNAWAKPDWDDGHAEGFVSGLMSYDPEIATNAVALAHKTLYFRPSFAEFLSFYRLAKTEASSRQDRPRKSGKVNKLPEWVKRWIVSRMLFERYGKQQDLRRFPEQQDWADPDVPLMPPDEWVKEAAAIGDREAMKAIQGQQ